MTSSPDRDRAIEPLPPAVWSTGRLGQLGYRHEPRLMAVAFVLSQLAALPDALLALWLMLLGKGVLEHRSGMVEGAAIGLGLSTAATWFLRTVSTRVQRRFRDRVTIALESPGAPSVHHRHDSAAREGSAGHRHRGAPDYRPPMGVGVLVPTGGRGAMGLGNVACAGVDDIWFGICRRDRVRVVRAWRVGQRGAAGAGRRCAAVGVHRCHRGGDWIPAWILDGWLAAARMARGLRRLRRGVGRFAGARRSAPRDSA